jgi:hypothetical protein
VADEGIYLILHRVEDTVYYRRAVEVFRLLSALQQSATLELAVVGAFQQSAIPGE